MMQMRTNTNLQNLVSQILDARNAGNVLEVGRLKLIAIDDIIQNSCQFKLDRNTTDEVNLRRALNHLQSVIALFTIEEVVPGVDLSGYPNIAKAVAELESDNGARRGWFQKNLDETPALFDIQAIEALIKKAYATPFYTLNTAIEGTFNEQFTLGSYLAVGGEVSETNALLEKFPEWKPFDAFMNYVFDRIVKN